MKHLDKQTAAARHDLAGCHQLEHDHLELELHLEHRIKPGRSSIGGCLPRTPQRQATRDPNPHRATGRRTVCGIVRTRSSAGVGCMGG
jgi:hypothetical protein